MTAADRLRQLASAAKPGPWTGYAHGSRAADADYIAAMHPGVALALADLLDAVVPLLALASVSFDGDPWFAIERGVVPDSHAGYALITKAADARARVEEALNDR